MSDISRQFFQFGAGNGKVREDDQAVSGMTWRPEPSGRRGCYGMGGKVLQPLLKDASIHTVNFAIVKIICKICIINIIKSLVGKTSDMTRVKGSLGRTGL